ncbi:MAG: hypothetical protein ACRDS9_21325 [Pseudonocardiaceae bacterium]
MRELMGARTDGVGGAGGSHGAPHHRIQAGDPTRWERRLHRVSALLAPALVYLAIRQVSLLVLIWMSTATGVGIRGTLTSWDGAWFLGLAEGGYGGVPAGFVDAFGARTPHTSQAFLPGYPALIAAVSWLPGVGLIAAAFVVTAGAGVATAYGLVRLAETVPHGSRKAGLVLVALFAATPMSIVLSMTYSEALFCALAVWCLLGLLRRQWLLAGVCSATAGLVRPTAAALVATVVLVALVAVVAGRDGWRPWVAALLAPSGLVGYLAFVAARTGRWDGWFVLQRQGWDSGFDGGYATVRFAWRALTTAPSVLEVITVWLLVAALALFVLCLLDWRASPAWPLLVYAAVVLALDLGSNGVMNSKARLLLPAFVLLMPVAIGLARRRTTLLVLTLTALTAFGAWFGGYALMVWPYAI